MTDSPDAHSPAHDLRPQPALLPRPAEIIGSPAQLDRESDVPFWTPRWTDGLTHLGWRWWLLIPAVIVIGLIVVPFFFPAYRFGWIWRLEFKLLKCAIILPAYMFLHVVRKSIQFRKEPFCIHCGYNLTGLPDNHRCPECGRPYAWSVINEYRRDPEGFRHRWRALGQLPAAAAAFEAGAVKRKKRARDGTE